jgi:RimJ/RimL family protein N-acetyltransferase
MIKVTRASLQDAGLFAEMEQSPDTRQYIVPYAETEHAQRILDPNFVCLRILDADELAGFIILVLDPDQCSIEFRRIVVTMKGRGIGQSAIAEVERLCLSELHRKRVWLDVFECNVLGRHVYQKLGYTKYGEKELDGKELLLYEKRL